MHITRKFVRDHPEKIFIFGDNCLGRGFGGQAGELRGEPNSYGIPTKKYPSMKADAFFTDDEFEDNVKIIDEAFARIPIDGREIVILPLGTGLAQLPQRAPKTYEYLVTLMSSLKDGDK
jgi:hypothetical protein